MSEMTKEEFSREMQRIMDEAKESDRKFYEQRRLAHVAELEAKQAIEARENRRFAAASQATHVLLMNYRDGGYDKDAVVAEAVEIADALLSALEARDER